MMHDGRTTDQAEDVQETDEEQIPLAPRGGNSAMSIPPGVDLDANYAMDDWDMNHGNKGDSDKDQSAH